MIPTQTYRQNNKKLEMRYLEHIKGHEKIFFISQGILDLIVTTYGEDGKTHIQILKQRFSDDAFFLKVKGQCNLNISSAGHSKLISL